MAREIIPDAADLGYHYARYVETEGAYQLKLARQYLSGRDHSEAAKAAHGLLTDAMDAAYRLGDKVVGYDYDLAAQRLLLDMAAAATPEAQAACATRARELCDLLAQRIGEVRADETHGYEEWAAQDMAVTSH